MPALTIYDRVVIGLVSGVVGPAVIWSSRSSSARRVSKTLAGAFPATAASSIASTRCYSSAPMFTYTSTFSLMSPNTAKPPWLSTRAARILSEVWLSLARYVKRLKNQPRVQVTPACRCVGRRRNSRSYCRRSLLAGYG